MFVTHTVYRVLRVTAPQRLAQASKRCMGVPGGHACAVPLSRRCIGDEPPPTHASPQAALDLATRDVVATILEQCQPSFYFRSLQRLRLSWTTATDKVLYLGGAASTGGCGLEQRMPMAPYIKPSYGRLAPDPSVHRCRFVACRRCQMTRPAEVQPELARGSAPVRRARVSAVAPESGEPRPERRRRRGT